jgi:hypothetical protein
MRLFSAGRTAENLYALGERSLEALAYDYHLFLANIFFCFLRTMFVPLCRPAFFRLAETVSDAAVAAIGRIV